MPYVKKHFFGIYAAKDWLGISVVGEKTPKQFANTKKGERIRSQDQNSLERGKEKKVAPTAYMHKFLTILNAIIRDQQPFCM